MGSAAEAYRAAQPGSHTIGWRLPRNEREALLARFPPRHANAVADHVTMRSKVRADCVPPATTGLIVGRSDDGRGVEAMVVQIDGGTDRPARARAAGARELVSPLTTRASARAAARCGSARR